MLWDAAPHVIDLYTQASGVDSGGGVTAVFTLVQANCPCLINTSSASEKEIFAQMGIQVSHRVAFKASVLTTPLTRGMKLVSEGASYHVEGIAAGQEFGSIPRLVYATCSQQL